MPKKHAVMPLCLIVFLLVAMSVSASEVSIYDNVSIVGGGNVLKFPDTTSQSTAFTNGAVTTAKLADGAVTAEKIANGAITASRIYAGTITSTQLASDAVGSSQLAAGAVTAAKLGSRSVSSDKIAFYTKVAVVSASGGDYSDPAAAMTDYVSWCGTPSESNRCLVKIMPGVYAIGTSYIYMRPYIDVEGSGENTTKVVGNINSSLQGIVFGASNAELRFLTLEHTGGSYSNCMYNFGASPKITNVTMISSGATGSNYNYGMYNASVSRPVLNSVTINVTGSGSANSTGMYNVNSSPVTRNSSVSVSGGYASNGVYNEVNAEPVLNTVSITVSGGSTFNRGVVNASSCYAQLQNVGVSASGGVDSYGFQNVAASAVITNSRIVAAGGSNTSTGIANESSSTISVHSSIADGADFSINNESGSTLYVGVSQLKGAKPTQGTIACAGAYSENFTALNTTCQ